MAPPTIAPPNPAEGLCDEGSWERAGPVIEGRGSTSSGSGVDSVSIGMEISTHAHVYTATVHINFDNTLDQYHD